MHGEGARSGHGNRARASNTWMGIRASFHAGFEGGDPVVCDSNSTLTGEVMSL
jgi:hypothetical protein